MWKCTVWVLAHFINLFYLFFSALISVGGKLYCIGGCVGQNSVTDCEVFDTETKTWSKIAPLPTGITWFGILITAKYL